MIFKQTSKTVRTNQDKFYLKHFTGSALKNDHDFIILSYCIIVPNLKCW